MPPTVNRDTAIALEYIERLAWRDQLEAATDADRASLGLRTLVAGGTLMMASDRLDSLMGNRVLGMGLHEPLTDAAIEAVAAHYPSGGSFAINLCPFAEPAGAEERLTQHGFATYFHHLKWVRGIAPVTTPETDLEVVAIGTERAHEWEALYSSIHDLSPDYATWSARTVGRAGWTHHLALDGGQPVAACAMFVHGPFAWLGKGGTLESHRRRGAQGALIAARVQLGLEAGVQAFAMETAPDWPDLPGGSLRNAARAGFRPAYARPSWVHGLRT